MGLHLHHVIFSGFSLAQWVFIATVIVIIVPIYRAAWATRPPQHHPKLNGPSSTPLFCYLPRIFVETIPPMQASFLHYHYCCYTAFIAAVIVIAVIIYRAGWVTRSPRCRPKLSGLSSPLLSLSLLSSTEPRGPLDRHATTQNPVSFIATIIVIAVVIYRAATRSRWSRPKPSGSSSTLLSLSLLSSTEPRGAPGRQGPVHSSVNPHRHHYRYCCCHLQSGHQIAMVSSKAQLASSPVGLHRHSYRYRCYHLQSRAGHSIATVPSVAQLTFIATIIVIAVIIYRAAWATRSPRYHPKPS